MAKIDISIESGKGVTAIISRARTVHEAIESADLLARTAYGIRLIHQAIKEARAPEVVPQVLPAAEHEIYLCRCSDVLFTASEAICHVQNEHCSWEIQKDYNKVENTISAMVTPDPRIS